jgi:hypothetical protein
LCKTVRENITRIVTATIPPRLKKYAAGFTETWLMFYACTFIYESFYEKGFITLPENNGVSSPIASYIYENV